MQKIGAAQLLGATARELLASGSSGRVLAVVTSAVYVIASPAGAKQSPTSSVEIVWLAQSHLPMHLRAISGNFDFGALSVGMVFESDGRALRFDAGDHSGSPLQFANAHVWQPAMIDPARVAPHEIVTARASEIQAPRGSLARKPGGALRDLIGLGEGLTPAGDDFLGGALFARWHLRAAYPEFVTWDQHAVNELMAYARPRTNVISYAILLDHARGQSIAPLHELIATMLTGGNKEEIRRSIEQLTKIGSSTGDNLMAGVITGVRESLTPIHY